MPSKRRHGRAVAPGNVYEKKALPGYVPTFTTAEKFVEKRITMLERDFKIELSYEEKKHLKSLKTERAINAAVRDIIDNAWME